MMTLDKNNTLDVVRKPEGVHLVECKLVILSSINQMGWLNATKHVWLQKVLVKSMTLITLRLLFLWPKWIL